MYTIPDIDEVIEVAETLGIHLGPDEAELYRKHLAKQMANQDEFVQSRIEEVKPPLTVGGSPAGLPPECGRGPTQRVDSGSVGSRAPPRGSWPARQ